MKPSVTKPRCRHSSRKDSRSNAAVADPPHKRGRLPLVKPVFVVGPHYDIVTLLHCLDALCSQFGSDCLCRLTLEVWIFSEHQISAKSFGWSYIDVFKSSLEKLGLDFFTHP